MTHSQYSSVQQPGSRTKTRSIWVKHSRLLFIGLLLLFIKIVLMVPNKGIFAQGGDADHIGEGGISEVELHEKYNTKSAASCLNVPHAQPLGTKKIDVLADGFGGAHMVKPPNIEFGPVLVDLGLFIDQITEINPVDNTFKIEGFLDLVWCDPRLRFSNDKAGYDEEVFLEMEAKKALNSIWWPNVTIVNEVGKREIENEELVINPDGRLNTKKSSWQIWKPTMILQNSRLIHSSWKLKSNRLPGMTIFWFSTKKKRI